MAFHQNVPLVITLAVFTILTFGATLSSAINIMTVSLGNDLQKAPKQWLLDFTLASAVVADFCVAAVLSFLFYRFRGEYYEGTNNMLNTLFKYTVNTGLIATLWTVCCLIANVMMPKSYVMLVFYLPLSKVYVNAFLGSLNARDSLREMSKVTPCLPQLSSNSIVFARPENRQGASAGSIHEGSPKSISIRIDSETGSRTDVQRTR